MPGVKGKTNNPHGRPPDERVKLFRDTLREKLIERIPSLFIAIDSLEGKEYVDAYMRILKDVLPPLAIEVQDEALQTSIVSIFDKIQDTMSKSA